MKFIIKTSNTLSNVIRILSLDTVPPPQLEKDYQQETQCRSKPDRPKNSRHIRPFKVMLQFQTSVYRVATLSNMKTQQD